VDEVIRKSDSELADAAGEVFRPVTQVDDGLSVTSQLSLGVAPRLKFSWTVDKDHWKEGFRLLVFHNTSGFAPDRDTDDLTQHGQLIIDTTTDGSRDEQPCEGKHFYTFVLRKLYYRFFKKQAVVRLSETVTTAKIGIGRIRDQMELDDLQRRHEMGDIVHEANLNEAEIRLIRSRADLQRAQGKYGPAGGAEHIIAEKLANIDLVIATLSGKYRKIEDMKIDERFTSLDPHLQEVVLSIIEEEMEPGDVKARRDKRDS
jgi:hypothetical protein